MKVFYVLGFTGKMVECVRDQISACITTNFMPLCSSKSCISHTLHTKIMIDCYRNAHYRNFSFPSFSSFLSLLGFLIFHSVCQKSSQIITRLKARDVINFLFYCAMFSESIEIMSLAEHVMDRETGGAEELYLILKLKQHARSELT